MKLLTILFAYNLTILPWLFQGGILQLSLGTIGFASNLAMITLLINHVETNFPATSNRIWGNSSSRLNALALIRSKAFWFLLIFLSVAALVLWVSLWNLFLYLRHLLLLIGGSVPLLSYVFLKKTVDKAPDPLKIWNWAGIICIFGMLSSGISVPILILLTDIKPLVEPQKINEFLVALTSLWMIYPLATVWLIRPKRPM